MVTTSASYMGLLMFGVIGLGVLFFLAMILRTLTGRTQRGHQPAGEGHPVSHPRSVLAPVLMFVGLLVAGVVMVGLLTVVPYQKSESSAPRVWPSPPAIEKTALIDSDGDAAEQDSKSASKDAKSLPSWTKREQTILASGEVPKVLFVETSGLYSTQEEAMAEATRQAISKFRSRLAETYRNLAVQPVPENIFKEASLQQVHIEKRMHSFGTFEEPMYRVYLEYMDSAEAREPVIEAWKTTFASNRAIQYGVVFGIFAVGLGVVSAGLRAVSAAKGSRGRAVMAALAFAGLGLVGLLFAA